MANNFSADSDCVALWNFETGQLGTDSKSTNTLTPDAGASANGTYYKQGSYSITSTTALAASITDANLSSDFPIKYGGTPTISACAWVYFPLVNIQGWVFYKGSGFGCYVYSDGKIYVDCAGTYHGPITAAAINANAWYHISVAIDSVAKTLYVEVYRDSDSTLLTPYSVSIGTMGTGVTEWSIGRDNANSYIDEVVVFKKVLTPTDMANIRSGTYGAVTSTGNMFMAL